MARDVEIYFRCSEKESKTKDGLSRNQSSTMPEKAARRKLEVPMPAAMLFKIPIKSSGETHRNIGKRKTQYA